LRSQRADDVRVSAGGNGDDECQIGNAGDTELQVETPGGEQVRAKVDEKDDPVELPGPDGYIPLSAALTP
jgi:hypothetical protein